MVLTAQHCTAVSIADRGTENIPRVSASISVGGRDSTEEKLTDLFQRCLCRGGQEKEGMTRSFNAISTLQITVLDAFHPFTVSPVLRVKSQALSERWRTRYPAESTFILKLFDSRFASDLRQHHEVPDLTPVIAAAAGYRAFFQQESKTFEEWDAKRIELHRSNERGRSNCSCCTSRGPGVIVVPVPIPYVVYLQIIISRKRKRKKNIPGLETHPSLAPVVIGAAAIAVAIVIVVGVDVDDLVDALLIDVDRSLIVDAR